MIDIAFGRLTQLAFGYWHAQPLFALAELGIFDAIAQGPRSAVDLACRIKADERALAGLLNAGAALGLLRKSADGFANSDVAKRFLTSASPESLLHWVRVMGRWSEPWTKLRAAIETGQPVEPQALRLGADPGYLEDFILGMHEYARRSSGELASAIDLSASARLVDVGGGAGTYAIALAEHNPRLKITLLDLPVVLPFARRLIADRGLAERISLEGADYQQDSFGSGVDAVLFSNVMHQEAPEICVGMLRRALAALKPGGRVLVHGHFLDEARTSPLFATLHNLSAYALWTGGRSYTVREMSALMEQAGVARARSVPLAAAGTTLIEGFGP